MTAAQAKAMQEELIEAVRALPARPAPTIRTPGASSVWHMMHPLEVVQA